MGRLHGNWKLEDNLQPWPCSVMRVGKGVSMLLGAVWGDAYDQMKHEMLCWDLMPQRERFGWQDLSEIEERIALIALVIYKGFMVMRKTREHILKLLNIEKEG